MIPATGPGQRRGHRGGRRPPRGARSYALGDAGRALSGRLGRAIRRTAELLLRCRAARREVTSKTLGHAGRPSKADTDRREIAERLPQSARAPLLVPAVLQRYMLAASEQLGRARPRARSPDSRPLREHRKSPRRCLLSRESNRGVPVTGRWDGAGRIRPVVAAVGRSRRCGSPRESRRLLICQTGGRPLDHRRDAAGARRAVEQFTATPAAELTLPMEHVPGLLSALSQPVPATSCYRRAGQGQPRTRAADDQRPWKTAWKSGSAQMHPGARPRCRGQTCFAPRSTSYRA